MDAHDKNILIKRFQTTMIGSLHEFEKNFGFLWGHNKDEKDLTNEELDFWDRWDFTRNKILNNGNNQLRQAIKDLDKHNGHVKFTYNFHNKKDHTQ